LLEARIANGDEAHLQNAMLVAIRIMEARVLVLLENLVEQLMLVSPSIILRWSITPQSSITITESRTQVYVNHLRVPTRLWGLDFFSPYGLLGRKDQIEYEY
jgi:hypothetical protein